MNSRRILNVAELCENRARKGRHDLLEILDAGLAAADPYRNTLSLLSIEKNNLVVGNDDFVPTGSPQRGEEVIDLATIRKIYVVGAGKGVQRVAKALEEILGEHLSGGHVIDKHGAPIILQKIGVTLAAHPIPDAASIQGCLKILKFAQDICENDLIFTIAANGISSLLTLPAPGVTLEDIRRITYLMQVEKGAPTSDLNPIRNHLDLVKGGRLSARFQPARAIHLVVYDPNGLGIWQSGYDEFMHHNVWLHTLPECTTFQDAVAMLKKWDAWDAAPESIRVYLSNADSSQETIKPEVFEGYRFRIFALMPEKFGMLPVAQQRARELGYTPYVLSTWLETEASHAGPVIASVANSIEKDGVPFEPPCALFTRGEMVVTVGSEKGIGGRNQEYVVSAALKIKASENIFMGAVDSDGTDGPGAQFSENAEYIPTFAGGIVDGDTVAAAQAAGIDFGLVLKQHNTSLALAKLNSGIQAIPSISLSDLGVTLVTGRKTGA